jgi:dTDP-4-dehydrorhamnose reductase
MKKKMLITGGSGLLGQYLNISTDDEFEILTLHRTNTGNCKEFNSAKVDIRNENELKKIFEHFRPDIVIHAAAITNPQLKENQRSRDYFETNVTATKKIAARSQEIKAKLIYISTDLVYAGYRGSLLKEDAKLIPVTLYAETKLMGEVKVKETTENHLILRTALLYGIGLNHSQCYFDVMLKNLSNGIPVRLFSDQFRTPISLKDASRVIAELAKTDLKNETFNLGGLERLSRNEMGELLCSIAGYDKKIIEKITMDDIPDFPKVVDVSLNTEKLQSLGFKAGTFEENISEMIKGLKD